MLCYLGLGNFKVEVSQHQIWTCLFRFFSHKKPLWFPALFIQILTAGLFYSDRASCNPEFVIAKDVPGIIGLPRKSLVVVFNVGTTEKPDFRMQKPTVVPISDQGKILWYKDDSWRSEPINFRDRILIEQDMLGRPASGRLAFQGCTPKNGALYKNRRGTLWLASCDESVTKKIDDRIMRVVYDEAGGAINSRFYRYTFKPENQMLFKEVSLKGDSDMILAKDSDLYIRSDVKNFFTLNFSSADIESKMMDYRVEPLTALASLGFYLRVLFFKLTLDLRTDVAFFESSANIPMVMTLPVNAAKRLNSKSGVLYSFQLGDNITKESLRVNMPTLKSNSIFGEFSAEGLPYCLDYCRYDMILPSAGKRLKLQITMAKNLVEKGFFPWFVSDVSAMRKDMDWSLRSDLGMNQRVGIYFEVSKLPKGSHPWDFWISF